MLAKRKRIILICGIVLLLTTIVLSRYISIVMPVNVLYDVKLKSPGEYASQEVSIVVIVENKNKFDISANYIIDAIGNKKVYKYNNQGQLGLVKAKTSKQFEIELKLPSVEVTPAFPDPPPLGETKEEAIARYQKWRSIREYTDEPLNDENIKIEFNIKSISDNVIKVVANRM